MSCPINELEAAWTTYRAKREIVRGCEQLLLTIIFALNSALKALDLPIFARAERCECERVLTTALNRIPRNVKHMARFEFNLCRTGLLRALASPVLEKLFKLGIFGQWDDLGGTVYGWEYTNFAEFIVPVIVCLNTRLAQLHRPTVASDRQLLRLQLLFSTRVIDEATYDYFLDLEREVESAVEDIEEERSHSIGCCIDAMIWKLSTAALI